jgi:hypothetical protein
MPEDLSGSFVAAASEPGSILSTDGWRGYQPLRERYAHRQLTVGKASNASNVLPHINRTFSNLETWLEGTHHGVGTEHVPHHLDKLFFRHERRKTPMAVFQARLGLTSYTTPPHTRRRVRLRQPERH